MSNKTKLKGFTLIEILVVVGLIAILAAITIVAINPAKNFADTRNTQRTTNVGVILSAVTQYTAEKTHSLADLGTIPTCPTTAAIGTSGVDLASTLVPEYAPALPMDPQTGTAADTGYTICKGASNRVMIAAPDAENGQTIFVQ